MKYEINQAKYSRLSPLCTVSDDSEVTMECQSPYTYSALSTTSDTISAPYIDRQHCNNAQPPGGLYVHLAANANQQNSSLQNPSMSPTELGISSFPDNGHHQLKESEYFEDSNAGSYVRMYVYRKHYYTGVRNVCKYANKMCH